MRHIRLISGIIAIMLLISEFNFYKVIAAPNQTIEKSGVTVQQGEMTSQDAGRAMKQSEMTSQESMKQVAENSSLKLFINTETTEIAVLTKSTGAIWYSSPQNRENDSIAKGEVKTGLGAAVTIEYFADKNTIKKKDSFNDSVANKTFKIKDLKDGVRIEYTIGSAQKTKEDLPSVITKDRFDKKILNNIKSEEDKKAVLTRYSLLSLSKAKDNTEREKMLKENPALEKSDIYVLSKYTPQFELNNIYSILEKSGYTLEDLKKDNEENKTGIVPKEKESFFIPLEYKLEGDNLTAQISCKEISALDTYPLSSIRFLENFGAADTSENGYIFVPDGSGALINFNNGKTGVSAFNMKLYGADGAVKSTEMRQYTKQAALPVYGMKKGENAFLTVIEEGDSHAAINADISGKMTSYNTVGAFFTIKEYDQIKLTDPSNKVANFKVFRNDRYNGNIKLRYFFLGGENADYNGMANAYRGYLEKNGALKALSKTEDIPFFIDILGAVKYKKPIMGIPLNRVEAMTTFDETRSIVEYLNSQKVLNIRLKYSGWFNGGINNSLPNSISIESVLGGKKEFQKLNDYAAKNNISVFYDTAIQNVYSKFPSFLYMFEASSYVFKETAVKYPYDLVQMVWNTKAPYSFVLGPSYINKYVQGYADSIQKLNVKGISFRDLSNELNSDFNPKRTTDRETAKSIVEDNLKKVKEKGFNIALNEANAYALSYADAIFNMPLENSNFSLEDRSVPFYPMVVHGYIQYSGEILNNTNNFKDNLLKTVENGAGLQYNWSYKDSSVLKLTEFNTYNSTYYKDWIDNAVKEYNQMKEQLGDIAGKRMLKHTVLRDNVIKVTYEGGKNVYVNYGNNDVTVEGVKVGARDYVAVKGGALK